MTNIKCQIYIPGNGLGKVSFDVGSIMEHRDKDAKSNVRAFLCFIHVFLIYACRLPSSLATQ